MIPTRPWVAPDDRDLRRQWHPDMHPVFSFAESWLLGAPAASDERDRVAVEIDKSIVEEEFAMLCRSPDLESILSHVHLVHLDLRVCLFQLGSIYYFVVRRLENVSKSVKPAAILCRETVGSTPFVVGEELEDVSAISLAICEFSSQPLRPKVRQEEEFAEGANFVDVQLDASIVPSGVAFDLLDYLRRFQFEQGEQSFDLSRVGIVGGLIQTGRPACLLDTEIVIVDFVYVVSRDLLFTDKRRQ